MTTTVPVAGSPGVVHHAAPPWAWRTRVVVAAAAAWLVFLGLHQLLSGRWWLWLIPEMLPPITFVAVPLALLALAPLARPVRRWVAVAAAVAVVLGAGHAGVNPAVLTGGGTAAAPPGALRVVSWNAGVWNHDDEPGRFYAYLSAQDADIYLLQEYAPAGDAAATDLDLAALRRTFPGYEQVLVGELLTLSRFPVAAVRTLPGQPPPGASWQTQYETVKALRTDVRVAGLTLSLYNVHIQVQVALEHSPLTPAFYRALRDNSARRRTQYDALERDVRDNRHPLLVAGDFNTSPAMGDLRELAELVGDAIPANRSPYPASWSLRPGLTLWRLDWVFTSPPVRVHRYAFRDQQGMSDHKAQSLTISVAAAP